MEPPVNPYATPAPDSSKTWTAAEPVEEDGFLKFDVRLTQDSVCKILRWRGGWKTIVIPLFVSVLIAAGFFYSVMAAGKIVVNGFVEFIPTLFGIVFGSLVVISKIQGWEGKAVYNQKPYLQEPYKVRWSESQCVMAFRLFRLHVDPRCKPTALNQSGVGWFLKLKSSNKLEFEFPAFIPCDAVGTRWQQIESVVDQSASTSRDENSLPETSLLSAPSNAIAVCRLSSMLTNRLVEAWYLSNPFVFGSMLIYAAAACLANYRQQFLPFFLSGDFEIMAGVTGVLFAATGLLGLFSWWVTRDSLRFYGSATKESIAAITPEEIWMKVKCGWVIFPMRSAIFGYQQGRAGIKFQMKVPFKVSLFFPKRAFESQADWEEAVRRIENRGRVEK